MITRYGLLRKKAGVDDAAFRKHWKEVHGPIAMKANHMRHYYQNMVTDSQQRGVAFPRCDIEVDAMSELWFDSLHDMNTGITPAVAKELADDAALIMSDVKVVVTVKSIVIPIPKDRPLLKRMSFITRRPGMSVEEFKHEWWYVHGDFVRQFKGVRGYAQALILDRVVNGVSVPYEQLPLDGIVELYFDDLKGLEQDFASEPGQKAQAHARTFLEKISTYVVEATPILP